MNILLLGSRFFAYKVFLNNASEGEFYAKFASVLYLVMAFSFITTTLVLFLIGMGFIVPLEKQVVFFIILPLSLLLAMVVWGRAGVFVTQKNYFFVRKVGGGIFSAWVFVMYLAAGVVLVHKFPLLGLGWMLVGLVASSLMVKKFLADEEKINKFSI